MKKILVLIGIIALLLAWNYGYAQDDKDVDLSVYPEISDPDLEKHWIVNPFYGVKMLKVEEKGSYEMPGYEDKRASIYELFLVYHSASNKLAISEYFTCVLDIGFPNSINVAVCNIYTDETMDGEIETSTSRTHLMSESNDQAILELSPEKKLTPDKKKFRRLYDRVIRQTLLKNALES